MTLIAFYLRLTLLGQRDVWAMNFSDETKASASPPLYISSNQTGIREHNERLVLTTLRRKGPLPKAVIARETGLSPQAASVIVRALENDGLLIKGERKRGKVGQPSIPISLAPDGAYFIGLKVGRRSAELVLINFVGNEIAFLAEQYNFPTPESIMNFVKWGVDQICKDMPAEEAAKIAGMGIATPYFLWEWASVIGLKAGEMESWRDFDLRFEVSNCFDFPIFLGNDATSACGAELTLGGMDTSLDFLYIYIGYFIGGGVVLNGSLFTGKSGNAGAIGPFPMLNPNGDFEQVVERASLVNLERRIANSRNNPDFAITSEFEAFSDEQTTIDNWSDKSAMAIAHLIIGACSIIDFPMVVIDGKMPSFLKAKMIDKIILAVDSLPKSGLLKPEIIPGTLGDKARALGAASLPLAKKFMLET